LDAKLLIYSIWRECPVVVAPSGMIVRYCHPSLNVAIQLLFGIMVVVAGVVGVAMLMLIRRMYAVPLRLIFVRAYDKPSVMAIVRVTGSLSRGMM
jgi:hypothetical protein